MCFSAGQRTFTCGCCDATSSLWCTTMHWPAKSPDLSLIVHVWDKMKRELYLQRIPQPLPNCDKGCKVFGTIYRRMTFGTFMTVCMREYTPALPPEGVTLCIDVTGYPLLWYVFFAFGLNLSYITYSYSDKLPVAWTFSWGCCIFPGSVCMYVCMYDWEYFHLLNHIVRRKGNTKNE